MSRPAGDPIGREAGAGDGVSVRLIIEGIEIVGHHGVYEEEKGRKGRFRIDIEVGGEIEKALASDEISDTVDHAAMARLVEEINRHNRFNLIESFAGAICDGLLERFQRLDWALVRVRKLSPPGIGNAVCTAAEVKKSRE